MNMIRDGVDGAAPAQGTVVAALGAFRPSIFWGGRDGGQKRKSGLEAAGFLLFWRKGWDSNPRTVARRRFSRPVQSTTLPPFLSASVERGF